VAQAYEDAGHEVRTAALYDPNRVRPDEVWPGDVPIMPGVAEALQAAPVGDDASQMVFWGAIAAAPDSFAAFAAAVRAAQPDLLQFEEPFLWPVVRHLQAEGLLKGVAIVHSSYNFETIAWRDLRDAGAPVSAASLRDIAALERDIAVSCDMVISVSEGDARAFRALGAPCVCVAMNGTGSLLPSRDAKALNAYLSTSTAYALFVSSAHPPNAHGLVDLAAAAEGHPVRQGELLICGEVGRLIRAAPRVQQAARILDRARFLGWVDNGLLGPLYAGARAVLLPKTLGGGSNLKTAEALASGRPIVATSRAFEGFEAFTNLPGVTVTDEPDRFWAAVATLLSDGVPVPPRPPEAMADLLWRECLKPMVRAAENLRAG
jgi:glycosyltransferase involved in cell wall biosynthesis